MLLVTFLLEAALVSLSGVMAPGPITAVTVGKGSRSPHAGAWVAVGHGVVEFPLMVAIFYGLGRLLDLPYMRGGIGLLGGVFLLWMGVGMLRSIQRVGVSASQHPNSPVMAGMLLSLGNPYFLIWWATVGAALILRATAFGVAGFLAFATLHWSCDFIWCYALSALSFKGGQFFGKVFQKWVFGVCGVFLLFVGGRFIADAVGMLLR